MKVLIAVDSFKGSLSSQQAGEAISQGIKRVYPNAETRVIPMADGGEGTVEAIVKATQGKKIYTTVNSPLGEQVEAPIGLLPDGTAVIEMAAASGLPLVSVEKRNPLLTTTYGTGELIKKALDLGAKEILIGIGGSATNDGGAGMAQALGVKFLDEKGQELSWGGGALSKLKKIDMSNVDPRLSSVKITVMCDVDNPLCGLKGASYVFGPQKGATPEMVKILDSNLAHFAQIIKEQIGIEVAEVPGAGAAGGLGAGLMAFLGAKLKSGVEAILDVVGFEEMASNVDLVITGEGRIDAQSLHGKVPYGIAKRAAKFDKPVIAIVGSIGPGAESLYERGINSIMTIVNGPMTLEDSLAKAYDLTLEATERLFRSIKVGQILLGR